MKTSTKSEDNLYKIPNQDYYFYIKDIIESSIFKSTSIYMHHANYSCYEHSLHVSYISFKLSKKFNLDYVSTARGALLHDFYLYDWHIKDPKRGIHGFDHPKIAHKNATQSYTINSIEKDIILKHMFPITIKPPRYKESIIVCLVDKFCTVLEYLKLEFFLLQAKSQLDTRKKAVNE